MSRLEILERQLVFMCQLDAFGGDEHGTVGNPGFYQSDEVLYSILSREERYLRERIITDGMKGIFSRFFDVTRRIEEMDLKARLNKKGLTEYLSHNEVIELLDNQ